MPRTGACTPPYNVQLPAKSSVYELTILSSSCVGPIHIGQLRALDDRSSATRGAGGTSATRPRECSTAPRCSLVAHPSFGDHPEDYAEHDVRDEARNNRAGGQREHGEGQLVIVPSRPNPSTPGSPGRFRLRAGTRCSRRRRGRRRRRARSALVRAGRATL